MRLLHLADLHLGTENYGRPDPQTGLNTRLFDFLRCLDVAVDAAIARKADAVVFAGDAYRNREPNPTHQREFARRIHRLVNDGIPVLLVAGNHDLPSQPAKASSLDVFSALEVPGVTVVRTPGVVEVETRSGVIRCACLPALPRSALIEEGDRRLDADALRRALSRRLAQIASKLAEAIAESPPDTPRRRSAALCPAILVAHVGVEGAMVGSETSLVSGAEPLVPLSAVTDSKYAYVALGHVHRFQEMNARPPVVYCGSPDRVDFGEEGQEKGFVIVDLEVDRASPSGWRASYEFARTPARRFVTIDVEVSGEDATLQVERAIESAKTAEAVVRVRVSMDEEQPLDEDGLRALLREAFLALPIYRDVRSRAATPRAPGVAERMTDPLAALDEYLKLRQVSEERAQAMRAKAEGLLADVRHDSEPVLGGAHGSFGPTTENESPTAEP
jgi:exonuclease SbcD